MSSMPMIEKYLDSIKELVRYAIVGILSNLAGYVVYILATHFGALPKITMTILYFVGATIGYIGHRNFTFTYEGSFLGSGLRYVIAHLLGYLINLIILIIFVDYYKYPHQWVQAGAIFVVAGYLLIAFKFFVFRKNKFINSE